MILSHAGECSNIPEYHSFFFTDIENCSIQSGGQTKFLLSPLNEPPKSGFIPRAQDQGISHREAIRCAPSLPVTNSQCTRHISTQKCSPSLMSCVHKDISIQRDSTSHFSQYHAANDIYCHGIPSHNSLGFHAGRLSPDAPSPPVNLHNVPTHLHQHYIIGEHEFHKFDRQFDTLRSEPQLTIS